MAAVMGSVHRQRKSRQTEGLLFCSILGSLCASSLYMILKSHLGCGIANVKFVDYSCLFLV